MRYMRYISPGFYRLYRLYRGSPADSALIVIWKPPAPALVRSNALSAHLPTPEAGFDARGVGRDQFFTLWKIERDRFLINIGTISHA